MGHGRWSWRLARLDAHLAGEGEDFKGLGGIRLMINIRIMTQFQLSGGAVRVLVGLAERRRTCLSGHRRF